MESLTREPFTADEIKACIDMKQRNVNQLQVELNVLWQEYYAALRRESNLV